MKKSILVIITLVVLTPCKLLQGSHSDGSAGREAVELFTDRNLYIAGESILFSAFISDNEWVDDTHVSRVLYCELITSWGSRISGGKFIIDNSHAEGAMPIPADLISGNYLLRAYTRKMRNYGPCCYSYIDIKVINPDRSEVQEGSGNLEGSEGVPVDTSIDQRCPAFIISPGKMVYVQRDTVQIIIKPDPSFNYSMKGIALAVVPESTVTIGNEIPCNTEPPEHEPYYHAEHLGLSLTGKLTDSVTGQTLRYTRVSLSILGKGSDFMAVHTDTAGRFFFLLPDYSGQRDLFLCAENNVGTGVDLLVDNDFCTVPVMIAAGRFSLSEDERNAAYRMAVNKQLGAVFYPDAGLTDSSGPGFQRPFYGVPDDVLFIDDYIELPTLEEYFNGLSALVRVRKSKGEKYFKVLGTQAGLNDFDPLVLIDLVAIDDPGKILAVQPSAILKIEMVNKLYVKGDETYGGIISIFSRNGDFAGIDLPGSGVFLNYDFLSEDSCQIPPVPSGPNIPDTRNTLFWDADFRFGDDRSAGISFMAPDRTGRYIIVVRGLTGDGKVVAQTRTFEVTRRKQLP